MKHNVFIVDFGATSHFTIQLASAFCKMSNVSAELNIYSSDVQKLEPGFFDFLRKVLKMLKIIYIYMLLFVRIIMCSHGHIFIFNIPLIPSLERFFLVMISFKGAVSVGILHNLLPSHGENKNIRNFKYSEFFIACDVVVFHDPSIDKDFSSNFPDSVPISTSIPNYKVIDASNIKSTHSDNILRLGILGTIRPYKNIEIILSELRMLDKQYRKSISLKICGKSGYDVSATIAGLRSLGLSDFLFVDEFLTEEQFSDEMRSVDFLLLPHLSSSGSALISVAMSFGIPLIASKLPVFQDVIKNYGCGVIFDHSLNGDLSQVILNLLSDKSLVKSLRINVDKAKDLIPSWSNYAKMIIERCAELRA